MLGAALASCSSSDPASGSAGATDGHEVASDPDPAITVSATTGLADRQEITIEGRGFEPGVVLGVAQCGSDPGTTANGCEAPPGPYGNPDGGYPTPGADGTFAVSLRVRSTLYTLDGGLVDCVPGGCRVLVAGVVPAPTSPAVEVELTFDPALAGGLDEPPPPGGCPAPHAPFGSRRWVSGDPGEPTTEALTPAGIEGDEVPIERVRAVQLDGAVQFEVLLDDGVVRTFTTAPSELGGHYPNRVQGRPGETGDGTFYLVTEPDGARDVVLRRASSGDYSAYAWHVDDPCEVGA